MEKVVDSYREYGGKWSGSTTHKIRHNALIFQDDELAQVLKALRRGSSHDKKLARKAFLMLTGIKHCPECGVLTRHQFFTNINSKHWFCKRCYCIDRLKKGWSITKSEALHYFTRSQYEELASQAPLDKSVQLLNLTDKFYGEYHEDVDYQLTDDVAHAISKNFKLYHD